VAAKAAKLSSGQPAASPESAREQLAVLTVSGPRRRRHMPSDLGRGAQLYAM